MPRRLQTKRFAYFGVALVLVFSLLTYSFIFKKAPVVKAGTNINDASNFGVINDSGRRVIRTSTGTLYVFLESGGSCQVWSSPGGLTWTQQNSAASPACSTEAGAAIDSTGVIHLLMTNGVNLTYTTLNTSTNLFSGTIETICACLADGSFSHDIVLDSNNKPHVIYGWAEFGGTAYTVEFDYKNKVSGSWSTAIIIAQELNSPGGGDFSGGSLVINEDNIPEISYIYNVLTELKAVVGNANNPTTFATHTISTTANGITSIGVDSGGNTWTSYKRSTDNHIMLVKHNDLDAWTTWQTPISSSTVGITQSLAIDGTNIYLFYEDSLDDIAYNMYNGAWLGSTVLKTGTYQNANAKWSYYFNNQGAAQIDYLYSDGTDVYWDKRTLTANTNPSGLTLIEPANSSTGIRGYPIFRLRASDADNDYLQYKIEICTTSNCSAIFRTIDQTVSQTGWSGQDANAQSAYVGNSSISSSTIATHLLQPPGLSANTQYWWRGYSIDPVGSNTWSSPSSIQTFTIDITKNVEVRGGSTIQGGGWIY